MKTIAIDIDDVISSCAESFLAYHNKYYGTSLSLREIAYEGAYWKYWENVLEEVVGISTAEAEKRFYEYTKSDTHISGQYISEHTKSCIKSLKDRYKLIVITARDISISDRTSKWVYNEFPNVFDGVYFTYDGDKKITKADVCRLTDSNYLIDDSVDHCNNVLKHGIKPILFGDYGWNSHQQVDERIYRAKDWGEVINFFKNEQNP